MTHAGTPNRHTRGLLIDCRSYYRAFYQAATAIGGGQSTLLRSLQQVARQTGHALGIYYTAATDDEGRERATYIHSKLLLTASYLLAYALTSSIITQRRRHSAEALAATLTSRAGFLHPHRRDSQ
jgi:hypothetical protein